MGRPEPYRNCVQDCEKFFALFQEAYVSIIAHGDSRVFDLSTIFLSIRNIATCFSLGVMKRPDFSRNSARHLGTASVPLSEEVYRILERARILCTRGVGMAITAEEVDIAVRSLSDVCEWMSNLVKEVKQHE
jgi:hypothetical protein